MRRAFALLYTPRVRPIRSVLAPSLIPTRCARLGGAALALFSLLLSPPSLAQTSSSSSSSRTDRPANLGRPQPTGTAPRIAQADAGGSAVTLETSEPLFDLAVALNACGYNTDLANSDPVRQEIRQQVDDLTAAPEAHAAREQLCRYIREHTLADTGLNIAQYVSLALYLGPAPGLIPTADETELPPDSTQVVNILPLLRTFTEGAHLHALWIKHHAVYEALTAHLHDPLTQMLLNTNIYLHLPVSSYDGRRFLVLLEPMLAPSAVNARIYGNDYVIVTSPSADPNNLHLNEIRHTYLHYEVEPMVYARASAMERLLPLLKTVQNAPLEFTYKSDIVSLLTECLIKAIEARTMDTGVTRPQRPTDANRQRLEATGYDAAVNLYERQSEAVRRRSVDLDMRQGWVLTDYFYRQLILMEKDGVSLKDNIGPMVYGMDVDRERRVDRDIAFLPAPTHDIVRRSAPQPVGLQLAEMKMMQGDPAAAEQMAEKALSDPAGDHATAHYILARINLMQRQPDVAVTHFQAALTSGHDARTLAWSHIYLGRLYDTTPDRKHAIEQYKAALAVPQLPNDSRVAAEKGLHAPFALPKRETPTAAQATEGDSDSDQPLDPSGKAEKESYRPDPIPQPPSATPHP